MMKIAMFIRQQMPPRARERNKRMISILEHDMKNALCAFSLQSELFRLYLSEDYTDETVQRLLEISRKTDTQVARLNDHIEKLRLLLKDR